jgi:hypothetical protein
MIEAICKALGSIPFAWELYSSMLSPSLPSNILFWSLSAGVLVSRIYVHPNLCQLQIHIAVISLLPNHIIPEEFCSILLLLLISYYLYMPHRQR